MILLNYGFYTKKSISPKIKIYGQNSQSLIDFIESFFLTKYLILGNKTINHGMNYLTEFILLKKQLELRLKAKL
ncbi:MAG: hypothetical protein C0168_05345 [Candidatus Aminicenantes bacterium]|nr:MAG: hypothetical protein C0168_05345 [Candidatus Aminicenantes bacterium]